MIRVDRYRTANGKVIKPSDFSIYAGAARAVKENPDAFISELRE